MYQGLIIYMYLTGP